MSYCRFSSDDFQCDVYCYEDVSGGFTTHVAGNHVVYKEPLPPPVEYEVGNFDGWYERHQKVMEMVGCADHVPIGLPHDGDEFNDATLEGMHDRLVYLKGLGYVVPDWVLENIREEIAEQAA